MSPFYVEFVQMLKTLSKRTNIFPFHSISVIIKGMWWNLNIFRNFAFIKYYMMTTEDIYKTILHPKALGTNVLLHANGKSKYSKSFCIGYEKDDKRDELFTIFGINSICKPQWDSLYEMAVRGDGQEWRRIDTLHSSSLLALLFFCGISEYNPLTIHDVKYTQCFFEVRNKVYDKASNIDVVLYSPLENKLLYLESKFSEYIHHGKAFVSVKYLHIYRELIKHFNTIDIVENITKTISDKKNNRKERVPGFEIIMRDGRNNLYLQGIKQMISHVIGIASGPADDNIDEFKQIFNKKEKPVKEFTSILFDVGKDELNNYRKLYTEAVEKITAHSLYGYTIDFELTPAISYQELISENPNYILPKHFKTFYGL